MSRIELLLALVFLLTLALGSQGCQLREDDRGEDCEIDCTTLSGSVLTQNKEGVPGLQLSFRYSKRGLFAGSRYIADFITDVSGEYNFDFYIPDEELEESGRYYVSLDSFLFDASTYIWPEEPARFYNLDRRDVTLYLDCHLAKKDYISVRVDNYIKIRGDESFRILTSFKGGFGFVQEFPGQTSGYIRRNRSLEPFENTAFIDDLLVAQGDTTWVTLFKNKRGVEHKEEIIIVKKAGENITIEKNF